MIYSRIPTEQQVRALSRTYKIFILCEDGNSPVFLTAGAL
jgi:hypothetical protein